MIRNKESQPITKAIKNRRLSSNIKVCSTFELHRKLKDCASKSPTFSQPNRYGTFKERQLTSKQMTKKLKNIISITLVFIFLTPMTIKLVDGLFHHHDHFHCTAKNEKHFHEHHEKCPIPSFKLSIFSVEKHIQNTQRQNYYIKQNDNYKFDNCCNRSKYSFLLQAPPIFTSKIMTS